MLVTKEKYEASDEFDTAYHTEKTSYDEWHLQAALIARDMQKTGLHITHEEMWDWVDSLLTDNPLPTPKAHL